MDEIKTRGELFWVYRREAEKFLQQSKENYYTILKIVKDKKKSIRKELFEEESNSVFCIITSVLALESLINMIGNDWLEPSIWEELERLQLNKKILIIPKLITGKTFNKKAAPFTDFIKINDLRNYLVHFKSFSEKGLVKHDSEIDVFPSYEKMNYKNAKYAYDTMEKMITELESILGKEF